MPHKYAERKLLYATNVLRYVLHVTGYYKLSTTVYVYMQFSFRQKYKQELHVPWYIVSKVYYRL